MRSVQTNYLNSASSKGMAMIAKEYSEFSADPYSGYGVGAALLVKYPYDTFDSEDLDGDYRHVYAGFNINQSGMEFKMHAEQLALFQALLDARMRGADIGKGDGHPELRQMVVVTTNHDLALKCGHCLQTLAPYADDEMTYMAAAPIEKLRAGRYEWEYERTTFGELWGYSYTERR